MGMGSGGNRLDEKPQKGVSPGVERPTRRLASERAAWARGRGTRRTDTARRHGNHDVELDAPVLEAAGRGVVGIDRVGQTAGVRNEATGVDMTFGSEPTDDAIGAPPGEVHVVLGGVPVVGVTFDPHLLHHRVVREHLGHVPEDRNSRCYLRFRRDGHRFRDRGIC